MLPYWLLFSVFATGALAYSRRSVIGQQATPMLTVAALVAAAMIGFRYEAGADWFNYLELFYSYGYLELGEALFLSDPGYGAVNWAASKLGLDIWAVNLVCGALLTWGLVKFAKRQPNPWLAVLVAVPYLIIVVAMGYSRQGVAIGFILAALAVLDRANMGRFAFYIICAVTFHKSAAVVLPLALLATVRHRAAIAAALGGLGIMLFFVFIDADLSRLQTMYIDAEYQSEGAVVRVAMGIVPAILFLLFQRRFAVAEEQRLLWRNFSYAALAMLALLLLLPSSTAVDRLALYLIPLQIFVLSRLPEAFPERQRGDRKLVIAVIAYSAAIQFVWINYADHAKYWLPYRAYFVSDTGIADLSEFYD